MSENNISQFKKRISELEQEIEKLRKIKSKPQTSLDKYKLNDAVKIILENEEKFKSLFNGINQPVFVHQLKSEGFNNFVEVNDISCQRYGYSRKEFLRLSPKDISSPEDAQKKGSGEGRRKLNEEGQAIFEATHITKDGRKFPVEISSNIFNWVGQKVILSIAMDITARKIAENALHESEEKYRHLIENSGDAIYLLYDRRFEIVNKKFTELFGVTIEQANSPDFDFMNMVSPESRPIVEERIRLQAEGKRIDPKYEFQALNANGLEILVETYFTYIKYKNGFASQGIIRDITEKRSLEQQLQQAQKMEAIGMLAGGVAHDFNNLLTVINGYSDMALISMEPSDRLYKNINEIKKAGKRAENLTRQLLAFSRKQIYLSEIIEINSVIQEMDKMLRRLIGEDISVNMVLSENLPKIKADKSQLEQIFINLVVNARDAVYAVSKADYKKKITVETGRVVLNKDYVIKHPGSNEGLHIFFSVSDNGIGMDESTKQRIFEPFFTTKEKFKGTGLGLATVYGIIKQNQGSVYVYSEPGDGTMFKIYWPATTEYLEQKAVKVKASNNLSGNESILFVEDDPAVCQFATNALESLGYNVSKSTNGKLAFEQIKSKDFKFDLILTDLIMPELNGKEFVEKVKKKFPDVKVIYVSGYTDNHIVHNGLLEEGVNFIHKPYSVKSLAEKIRQVLDNG